MTWILGGAALLVLSFAVVCLAGVILAGLDCE